MLLQAPPDIQLVYDVESISYSNTYEMFYYITLHPVSIVSMCVWPVKYFHDKKKAISWKSVKLKRLVLEMVNFLTKFFFKRYLQLLVHSITAFVVWSE